MLDRIDGMYYTAEDVGTSTADMDLLRTHTPYALGVSTENMGAGDPSPYTARGVVAAMRAGWQASSGDGHAGGRARGGAGRGKGGRRRREARSG